MMSRIEIMGDKAEAHKHDGSLESVRAVQQAGILCDGLLDHLSGKWWICFLSPTRGMHQAAPGDIIVRFPSNDFFAISDETFHEVATVIDDASPIAQEPNRETVRTRRKRP